MALSSQKTRVLLSGSTEAPGEAILRASLLDALGEAVFATDLHGHILYWNAAAADAFGWPAEEVLGSRVKELILAEGTSRDAAVVLAHIRQQGRWSGEFLMQHMEGRVFPVQATATQVRDPDGRPVGLVVVTRDISTQRRAEETARHSEERVELAHRAASSVIWEWHVPSGTVTRNEAMDDVFGYAPDVVDPTLDWWRTRVHPDGQARVFDSLDRFLSEDRRFWTEEYRFLTAEHGYAMVFDRAVMAHDSDGQPLRVVGTMVDLTERRRIHEEQRFLSQSSMILELSLDYESTLPTIARLAVNSIAEACVIAVAASDGFPPFVTSAHGDPRLQAVVDEAAAFLNTGPPPSSRLEAVLHGGGSFLVSGLTGGSGALLGDESRLSELFDALALRSVMVVPLSARRTTVGYAILATSRAEESYQDADLRMGEELGRRIGLTVDHARLFQSAQLAHRAKSDFLAVISHELRTPLTAVLGYSDLLEEEVAGPLNEEQHRQVSRIRAGSDRLLRLIEGILAFARLETGHDRAHLDRVQLRPLLEHVEDIVRPSATEKGIEFHLQVGNLAQTIVTDSERFTQVVLSLVTNAIKFTDRGAVVLRASCEPGILHVDVTDSGRGIAPEHLPHIFNPFWQAEQPATRRAGGAGLGLSIARRLARLMGGDVTVARTTPHGTTFRFEIALDPVV
jgi:PAS domain S-box-containing protein